MEMFQPQLSLSIEPDGEFTLDATTITPNSCYSATRVTREPPPNVRLVAEVFPVQLHLRARKGPCMMALRPVRHRARNLKLGAEHGKTSVLAFVVLDGRVVGSASIPVPAACNKMPTKNPATIDTSDWYAWINKMPPGPASMHVTGMVQLPNPGYDASLVPAAPQGINPADLILDLVVKPRPGFWPEVITPATVRYDLAKYDGAYKTVLIREPDGDAVQLEIEEVY
jgi:hypothetical protein